MSVGLFFNQIKSLFYGFVGWFIPVIYSAGVYVYSWIHFPNYAIYIDGAISTTSQLYVEDIQLSVKYTRNRNGAIIGYVGEDELIDLTDWVGHISNEGTIMVWCADQEDMFCVVIPYGMKVNNLLPNGEPLDIVPQPEVAQRWTSTNIRWLSTDAPGHFFIESPRVSIEVKWNRDSAFPYVDHTYFPQVTSRFDDKKFEPKFVTRGISIDSFRLIPPMINSAEFNHTLDLASMYISMIRNKYLQEPATFNKFLKPF